MSPRKRYAFWIDLEHLEALDAIRIRDGILPSEQIRRALEGWIKEKDVKVKRDLVVTKPEGRRPASRRRS